jgi:hypothetical protein
LQALSSATEAPTFFRVAQVYVRRCAFARAQRPARLFLQQLSNTRKAKAFYMQEDRHMQPTELIYTATSVGELPFVADTEQCWVAINMVCEALGIDARTQRRVIEKHHMLGSVGGLRPLTARDGKVYDMLCLPALMVPVWLCNIHVTKVKPEARVALANLQRYLAAHMLRGWEAWRCGIPRRRWGERGSLLARMPEPMKALDHPDVAAAVAQYDEADWQVAEAREKAARLKGYARQSVRSIGLIGADIELLRRGRREQEAQQPATSPLLKLMGI